MEPEYYTPHISEIHFGFDFQYLSPTTKEWTDYKWNTPFSEITIKGTGLVISGFKIDKDMIRVKRLDKADIRSLGWKDVDKNIRLFEFMNKQKSYLKFSHTSFVVEIGTDSEGMRVIDTIRNKTELKKLMIKEGII